MKSIFIKQLDMDGIFRTSIVRLSKRVVLLVKLSLLAIVRLTLQQVKEPFGDPGCVQLVVGGLVVALLVQIIIVVRHQLLL